MAYGLFDWELVLKGLGLKGIKWWGFRGSDRCKLGHIVTLNPKP